MDIPYGWLREWLIELPEPAQVAEDLAGLGYEVAGVDVAEAGFAPVVLAEVVDRRAHPMSDHLALVTVRLAAGQFVTVVTGARNGQPGDKLWYGPPGTRLPDGRTLGTVELRGVESPGMLLSAAELGYRGDEGEDLWIWDGPEPAGTPWTEVMGTETVFHVELTPNLAQHAQSVLGVARDLAALYRLTPPILPAGPRLEPDAEDLVVVEDPAACPVYALQEFAVGSGRLPWAWQRRLTASGLRLIAPAVDATNYVLVDLGQPLHAFDADQVVLPIVVRRARPDEPVTLLDGRTVTLTPEDLVIADQEGVLAVAGVMGGRRAEVRADTRRVLVESAHFEARRVYRTARRLDLMTDAALRFSRGTDPAAVGAALTRFREVVEASGALRARGRAVRVGSPPAPRRLAWQPDRLRTWLGVDWTDREMAAVLEGLGFRVEADGVEIPTYRPDIDGGPDLAEEVARVRGMNAIPARVPARRGVTRRDAVMVQGDAVRDLLAAAGYTEVVPRNLIAPGLLPALGLPESPHRVVNPLREEESVLQSSVLPALLLVARYNRDRDVDRQAFFQISPVFLGTSERPRQEWELGVFRTFGPEGGLHGTTERTVYDLKGLVEVLNDRLQWDLEWTSDEVPTFLHPGRALTLRRHQQPVGWMGELHPAVADGWRLPPAGVVVLRLPAASAGGFAFSRRVRRPSRFPEVRRDLSLVVPADVSFDTLAETIRRHGGPALVRVEPFDRFVGSFGESLSLRLTFQADDRTLTEAEVDGVVADILTALSTRGVMQRGG